MLSQIDIDAIRAGLDGQTFSRTLSGPFGISISVTYTLHFTSGPTPVFQSGAIEISGTVALSGNKWWSPNVSVTFKQLITLVLDATEPAGNSGAGRRPRRQHRPVALVLHFP